jgi:hypothetical protein
MFVFANVSFLLSMAGAAVDQASARIDVILAEQLLPFF